MNTLRCHHGNFAGPQLSVGHISQIQTGKAFKGDTERPFFFPNGNGGSAITVSGRINSFGGHNQYGHRTFNDFLRILNALHQVVLLIQNRRHQLRGIDISAAHLKEMRVPFGEQFLCQKVRIINSAHSGNGIGSMVRTHHQRLGFIIRYTANPDTSPHFNHFFVKFCAKRRILNIMNRPVKSAFPVVNHHSSPPGAQMRMIICSEKYIKHAVLFGCNTKKTSHVYLPVVNCPLSDFLYFTILRQNAAFYFTHESLPSFQADPHFLPAPAEPPFSEKPPPALRHDLYILKSPWSFAILPDSC